MWFKKVGVTGTGDFNADEIEAGFSLVGLEFDVLVTVDDDTTISKQARRFCYNNKMHDRVKKIHGELLDELADEASILLHFGTDLNALASGALLVGIPVVCFPDNFTEVLKRGWNNDG